MSVQSFGDRLVARRGRRRAHRCPRPCRRRCHRAFSVVLFCFALVALTAFVTLGVDMGRVRLAHAELQTAADAGAYAGARELEQSPLGMQRIIDAAADAAEQNVVIDQADDGKGARLDTSVDLDETQDIQLGLWRGSTKTFVEIKDDPRSPIDERREANAIQVWGRRCTTFKQDGNTFHRNTGVPLIFGPVIGVFTGEVEKDAIAAITGGRPGYGFIGLDWVHLSGQPISDSYNAATQTYPGAALADKYGTFSSNGDIDIQGSVTVKGDVQPGVEKSITPYPLSQYVTVTGYLTPLEIPLSGYTARIFVLPKTNDNALITPTSANTPNFTAKTATFPSVAGRATNFVFTTWQPSGDGTITIKNDLGPINFYINGSFLTQGSTKTVIASQNAANPVTFWINGGFDCGGQGITNKTATGAPGNSSLLTINCCKAGSTVIWRGQADLVGHLYAPTCPVTATGQANFYGSIVGKTLTVSGQPLLHYDESYLPNPLPFRSRLVE